MSDLIIGHGKKQWWLSPDVWPVPATKPTEGSPGVVHPVVDNQYLVRATVTNTVDQQPNSAAVYFWWAIPALGIITKNANLIGFFAPFEVDPALPPKTKNKTIGETSPWIPSFVNGGHECFVAWVTDEFLASPNPPRLPAHARRR